MRMRYEFRVQSSEFKVLSSKFRVRTCLQLVACCYQLISHMINSQELRLGNYIMQKVNNRIITVACTYGHFELLQKGEKDIYAILLKAELLEKTGFIENKDYPLLPAAREFKLVLPVIGNNKNEILAYIKNNKECFARAVVNNLPVSNNIFHLHHLQNLYYALTGEEMNVTM